MDIHIITRHCTLSGEEHDAAVSAAEHLMKFHENILRVDIVASENAGQKISEFAVRVEGHVIMAREHAHEHMKAIHDARGKVERQLRRLNERRLKSRKQEAA